MKFDFLIFGGTGQQGRICARDLLESGYSVLLAGRDTRKIKNILRNKKSEFMRIDLKNDAEIVKAIKESGAEVIINCAELIFNVPIMESCLKTKKSITDLGGLQEITEKQFKLHEKFQKAGIINITGCGSTPGIVNVMVKHAAEKMDSVEKINLGFAWDSNIKKFVVPYSIQSIFDEFTKAPIIFRDGKFVKEKGHFYDETMNFREIGKQKVHRIVHSEVYTFSKYFKDKGIKEIHYTAGFPEHSLKVIETLIELGFNSREPVLIGEHQITPLKFTKEFLKKIEIPKNYRETENIWAYVVGKKHGMHKKILVECIVKTLKGWEEGGSNVDTGRTISIISQMVKNGLIKISGVFAPEAVIPCDQFFHELKKRKMFVYENGKRIN